MKLSLNWIKEYVDLPADLTMERLAYDLTMRTVEVEGVENPKDSLEGIVVGRILEVAPHPDANMLRVCRVDAGQDHILQIVCGGSNLEPGQKVAVSVPGAFVRWHGEGEPVEIGVTKLRGVMSEGMICGANELGLETLFPVEDEHIIMTSGAITVWPENWPRSMERACVRCLNCVCLSHLHHTRSRFRQISACGTWPRFLRISRLSLRRTGCRNVFGQ